MNNGIEQWVAKAQENSAAAAPATGVKVIRNASQSRGNVIMEVAEKIRPHLVKFFDGVHDAEGKLLQPAHIRAFALNMAQHLVKAKEQDNKPQG